MSNIKNNCTERTLTNQTPTNQTPTNQTPTNQRLTNQRILIYVLQLQDKKYYIGRTNNLDERLLQHKDKSACAWTTIHPYIKLIETYEGDVFDEDKFVIKYMTMHGINNVRGGSYSNVYLSFDQYITLRKMIYNAESKCLACGSKNHFLHSCKEIICYRCCRVGHSAENCYAITHDMNGSLHGCYTCGRPDHWSIRCYQKTDIFGRRIDHSSCIIC